MNCPTFQHVLKTIASQFVRYPNDLIVEEDEGSNSVLLTIHGNLADHPKLVGKHGQNIQSLQTIMAFVGAKRGKMVRVSLLSAKTGKEEKPLAPFVDTEWKAKKKDEGIKELIKFVCDEVLTGDYQIEIDSRALVTNVHINNAVLQPEFESALIILLRAIGRAKGRSLNFRGPTHT